MIIVGNAAHKATRFESKATAIAQVVPDAAVGAD